MKETAGEKVLAMLCNWCSYGGADNAGVSRMQYPTNARVIRVMCTGRVNPPEPVKAEAVAAEANPGK